MRKDMYNDYSNEQIPYNYPHQFNGGNFDYLGKPIEFKYIWDYEDTATINMVLGNEVTDLSLLADKVAYINFYNQLGHDVYEYSIDLNTINSYNKEISISINRPTSKNIFVKGIYTYRVKLVEKDSTKTDDELEVATIVPMYRDFILVK